MSDNQSDEFSPAAKPLFLSKEAAESTPYVGANPDAVPVFDDELVTEDPAAPSRGIVNRYREIARLHAFGKTNNEICRILGYSATRMSIVLKDPFVQAEISRWRDMMIDDDAIGIMKAAARDGAMRIHGIILDPNSKDNIALDASKFAVEKTHGKARQEVSVESGTLSTFMQMLKEMRERGEPIDVKALPEPQGPQVSEGTGPEGPESEGQLNRFDSWLDDNLD